jgi:putative transposase
MLQTMHYRLKPTKTQAHQLHSQLEECRWLYNHFLASRRDAWKERQESLSYHAQATALPALKHERPTLSSVHSQVLQNVAVRIDLAFKAFFRRCKAGAEPGYPRFRGKGRYNSMTFPQYGNGCQMSNGLLKLAKVGALRVVQHRPPRLRRRRAPSLTGALPLEGTPKTCTIRCRATGKWYVTVACEVETSWLRTTGERVGMDVGLTRFYTLSTGEHTPCPKFLRTDEQDVKRTQRKLSAAEEGMPERRKRRKIVARVHERIANRRSNFCHQESRRLVNRFDIIVVEDLAVNQMVHHHCLAKSIQDAAWSQFTAHLAYKAAYAGRQYVAVNPAYTSQDCSQCGHRQKKTLAERVHQCICCGLTLDRDHNAALNILSLGLQALGVFPRSSGLQAGE